MSRSNVKDIGLKKQDFGGIYRAVVEDNNDPLQLGRVRVRIWGLHTDEKNETESEGIPVSKLPWAEPCLGLVEGSISGYGAFAVPLKGSHVFVFFEGRNWTAPRYFATAPGRPVAPPDTTMGFNDPTGVLPRKDRLNEPDYHRLSRGDTTQTNAEFKNQVRDLGIKIAGGGTWDEPISPYKAKYPENIVLTTHRGICIELDNTHGEERVHVYHPSHTYIEIDKDGNTVFRNNKDRFEITVGTRYKHINGSDNETVNIDKTIKVNNNVTEEIGNNENRLVGKDCTELIGNNWTVTVQGNIDIKSGGNINMEALGTMTLKASRIDLNPPSPPADVYVPGYDPAAPLAEIAVNMSEDLEDGAPLPPETLAVYEAASVNPNPDLTSVPTETDTTTPTDKPTVSPDCPTITAGIDYNMYLSAHFKLRDLTTNCQLTHYNVKSQLSLTEEQIICNLKNHCVNALEPLLAAKGTFSITSGFRHGTNTSWHNKGSATDLQWAGLDDAGYYAMAQWVKENLPFTELILEYGGNRPWVHVAYNGGAVNKNSKTRTKVSHTYVAGLLKLRNIPQVGGA